MNGPAPRGVGDAAMPLVLRPPAERESTQLPDRLGALGRARRRALLAVAWFRLLALAGAAVAVACGLDVVVHLPGVVRAVLLVGVLSGVAVAFLRWVRPATAEPAHPLSVALLLEDKFPRLNDSLASAVDFLQKGLVGGSRFRRVAVLRAQNLSERYDFDAVVPTGRAWKAFWLAAVVAAFVVPLGVLDAPRTALALTRLADPFGSHPWPTKTTVVVLEPQARPDGRTLLAKGDAFAVKFVVRGVIPESAVVSVRLAGGGGGDEPVQLSAAEGTKELLVEATLDATRVPRDFEFRVTANDADTGWRAVTVAPPPRLVPLGDRPSPQVGLTFPAYTDLAPAVLPDGTGVVEAVTATHVHFRAQTDRRIASAVFRNQSDLAPVLSATAVAALAGDNPFGHAAAQLLADSATADIPVRVTGPHGTILEADFAPHLPGLYALRFTDEEGLTGVRLFDFRMFPDPSPVVAMGRPFPGRDALDLLPSAAVTVEARAEDRPFAVKGLAIEYRVGADGPFRTLPLADLEVTGRVLPALTGGVVGVVRPKPVGLDGGRVVPLALFKKPDGSAPADGDLITLRTIATDWDDRTALKEPGRSRDVEIRVLGRPSLEAQFQKQLADLRPALLRAKEEQRQAREKTAEAAKNPAALAPAEGTQRQVRSQVADPDAGLRAKADQLRNAARANNLPRSPTTEKIEVVADTLGRLADQSLEAAEQQLTAARQEAEKPGPSGAPNPDPKKVADHLAKANRQQRDVEAGLANLLERLEQWGGPGEVAGEARALKEQVGRTGQQADKAADKVPTAKPADKLTPEEKGALAGPAEKLDAAADQADKLLNKATRIAGEKDAQAKALRTKAGELDKQADAARGAAAQQPPGSDAADDQKRAADALANEAAGLRQSADRTAAEAKALRGAVDQADGDALSRDLRDAADQLRDNKPGESAESRQSAMNRLDKLAGALGEQPAESADELKKKQRQAGDDLDQLSRDQDELRKKAKEAEKTADPEKRAEELQKLAREQEKLRQKAEQLAQQLTRDRADKPADAVRRAAEQMEAAREEMQQGKAGTEKQEDALDRIDDALQKMDREQKQDQDQLSREKREQLAEQLKAIREKQKAAVDEADRVQGAAAKAKRWERPLIVSLKDLEDREKEIAEEVRAFAEKQLGELPVFGRLAGQSADAMERAGKYVGQRRDDALNDPDAFDADGEKAAHERASKPMRTALRRLDQILDSLKEDPKAQAKQGGNGGGGGGGGGGEGGGQPQDQGGGVPQLAQLKALRAMQAEVNERTAAFAKDHPDKDKLTDDEKDDLKELEQAQRDVAELFDKLASMFRKAETPETP